ncbi:MerR family transcriptional regulator [Clostridium sp. LIBA-8841]|uniref:MerR family transcriptional regulator n=1 Tax=Clostridium sp. LIBA-8841 TaxID=2987530 RepID=UPI002AC669FE|nr:MerR family transcriptional regulator [Clostridium sp. LIBA-8841]MDZ5254042.1 MerR family transcriptional regulator [Clostridium sp. LIBA-8841]
MKLSIGTVARLFNISKDTLRYYDKIGILTPEINEENSYRFYDMRHLEQLGLILGIKYLGISLSDIKEVIESGEIEDYYNLIQRQKEIIEQKVLELKKLEASLNISGEIINRIINFKNEYDFSNLNIENISLKLYEVKLKSALSLDNDSKLENRLIDLKDEAYLYFYKIHDDKEIIEEENILFIKSNKSIDEFLDESKNKDKIVCKNIDGKFVVTDFYGTVDEINKYILSINKYFKCNKDNFVFIEYEFYLPKKNKEVKYFVKIYLKTEK